MTVTATTATTTAASTTTASASAFESSDFQVFLKMLTTQLQNQDPLNPMESSDFAVQLATFSGVEQQVKTNQILTGMAGNSALSGIGQYAGWIGMEARVAAPAWFDGSTLEIAPKAATDATRAVLVVTNSTGTIVGQSEIAADGSAITWAGVDASGEPLPAGQYSFTLQSYGTSGLIASEAVEVYAKVTETRLASDGTVKLILDGGAEIAADSATALRAPQ